MNCPTKLQILAIIIFNCMVSLVECLDDCMVEEFKLQFDDFRKFQVIGFETEQILILNWRS